MKRRFAFLLATIASLALGGCLRSPVDKAWGTAFEGDRDAQVVRPAGVPVDQTPSGVDGVSAEETAKRYYEESTGKHKPPETLLLAPVQ
jgi:hypothetical protein